MANAGEIEVFRITPEVEKCYEHIKATRSVYVGDGERRYYSTKLPTYVGKFVKTVREGPYGDNQVIKAILMIMEQ